jgi:L-arabinokinase
VVERDTLTVDPRASIERLAGVLARKAEIVAAEAAFLRGCGTALVVADIPFLAGDAAEAAGVDAVAVGNFTWDWIYEAYQTPGTGAVVEAVRASYRKMRVLYQLPLGHEVRSFREVVPVPLLAERARGDRATTLARLGVDAGDRRPRVLVAMRGGVDAGALRRAAAGSSDVVFFAGQSVPDAPANLRTLAGDGPDFTDVLAACDIVVAKVGYGIVSDCIANGVALLHPPRTGFREDEISVLEGPNYLRMRSVSREDFAAGDWRGELTALLEQPTPNGRMRVDGDRVIAGRIGERLCRE